MHKNNFDYLIGKYLQGGASAGEKALLEEYYQRLEAMAPTELSVDEERELKEIMFQRIKAGMLPRKVSLRKRIYFRLAAAAAVLFLLYSGYWFLESSKWNNKPPTNVVNHAPRDIRPGREAAILTLADGKQILLDSTNGTIGKQAGSTVINLNGLLTYKATKKSGVVIYNTITTARGNQYQLVLADGSKIWLNSSSKLRFPTSFSGAVRGVELLNGEAYFEVAKNASQPFRVSANGINVEVLGTHFNVNSYKEEGPVKTTLIEGSVRLSTENSLIGSELSLMLQPGQQAILNEDKFVVSRPDITQVVAWKNGRFEFDNTDLTTIMRQISRWYDVDISYKKKPSGKKFGGSISKNLPLSNVLKLLEENGVSFKLEGKKLFVKP